MQSRNSGWKRLGVALSLLWLIAVAGVAAYEWFAASYNGYFVSTAIAKTGEPVSALAGNDFADLVPLARQFNGLRFSAVLCLPLACLWLLGTLWLWVRAGFRMQ